MIRRRVKRGTRAELAGFRGVFVGVMSIGGNYLSFFLRWSNIKLETFEWLSATMSAGRKVKTD